MCAILSLSVPVRLGSRALYMPPPRATGRDMQAACEGQLRWRSERVPETLETTLRGVFAVGDVRSGNVKRVASAVGEGAIAVHMVHRVLAGL
jgi:thioredoxin reductase (NADPH)